MTTSVALTLQDDARPFVANNTDGAQVSLPQAVLPVIHAANDEMLVRLWLDGRPETTQAAYSRDARTLLEHVGKPISTVTLGELQQFAASLAHLAPASQARKLAAVKSLFGFGHRLGYLPFDTARVLQLPRLKDRLAERIVPEADIQRLIALEPNPRNHVMLRLLYGLGLRISEACGLCWRDLKGTKTGGVATIHGKGGKTRHVVVPPKLWKQLAAIKRDAVPEDPVLRSRQGSGMDRSAAHRVVKAAAARAGLPSEFSAHWCRHAHATHSLERGARIHTVQQTLGHSSLTTTSRYTHIAPDDGSSLYLPE